MPQESDHVKRISELEADLATEKKLHYLATRLIGERDAKLEQMGGRVAELENLIAQFTGAKWIDAADMPSMPRSWYWAGFPGSWEWYSPERNQVKGIDRERHGWVDLGSKSYWGPFTLDSPTRISELEAAGPSQIQIDDQDARLEAMGKRIAELEAALETEKQLHKAMTNRSERLDDAIRNIEAAHEAVTATAIKISRQIALGEAAHVLLKLAHGARPMGLAEAAKVVADMAHSDKPLLAKDFTEESGQAKENP